MRQVSEKIEIFALENRIQIDSVAIFDIAVIKLEKRLTLCYFARNSIMALFNFIEFTSTS